jgi:hypothetical protein
VATGVPLNIAGIHLNRRFGTTVASSKTQERKDYNAALDYHFVVGFCRRWRILRLWPLGLPGWCGQRSRHDIIGSPDSLHVRGFPLATSRMLERPKTLAGTRKSEREHVFAGTYRAATLREWTRRALFSALPYYQRARESSHHTRGIRPLCPDVGSRSLDHIRTSNSIQLLFVAAIDDSTIRLAYILQPAAAPRRAQVIHLVSSVNRFQSVRTELCSVSASKSDGLAG